MKRIILVNVFLISIWFAFTTNASAIEYDSLILTSDPASKPENSSPAAEEEWLEEFLGFNIEFMSKTEEDFKGKDIKDLSEFDPGFKDWDFAIVKAANLWYVFADDNEGEPYPEEFLGDDVLQVEELFKHGVSHITWFDPPTSVPAVPEPATIFLLGSGLFGLARFRKKFRKG